MKKPFIAVVLAGGAGKRFWPLSTNKVLFPFFGKPLIEYSVSQVLPKEVKKVVVITSPENHAAISSFSFSVSSVTVVQRLPNGMADALLCAKTEIEHSALLVINGDDVSDPHLFVSVMKTAEKKRVFGVIPGWKTTQYRPLGYLDLDGERICRIVEKPGEGNEPSSYVNLLGHYIEDSDIFLNELTHTKSDDDDIYEKALTSLMKHDVFIMQPYEDGFATLKYPWHVLDVMEELFKRLTAHRGKNVEIKSNVVIEGAVYIDDDVRIFENTKISGPCYIGKGTIIGNNNIIRHSHIGVGCVTGFNTDITRSYIGNNCWFHSNYIGDSVIEENVSMGSGTVLANLRLDEGEISSMVKNEKINTRKTKLGAIIGKNVRIGVNTSIMPGVKIGKNTFVGAGVAVEQDVADYSFIFQKTATTVVKNLRMSTPSRDAFKERV